MASVLEIASAVEKIADAAEDIAHVVHSGLGILDDLRKDLRYADEIVSRVKVREGAPAGGRSLRDLSLPVEIGMWVIATRRGGDWDLDPGPDYVVATNDVLLIKGPEDGVRLARSYIRCSELPDILEPSTVVLSDLDRAVDLLVEMKNSAEVAVGLAYSALLFNDPALAAEVGNLEARSDAVHDEARIVGAQKLARSSQPRRPARTASSGARIRDHLRLRSRDDAPRRTGTRASSGDRSRFGGVR